VQQKIASEKVAIYIRWSTEDQGQGHTLEIQRESCRYYSMSQGWVAREDLTFIDEGYSGSTLERPALTRLRQAVREGLVDCVVVYKLDRLSRNIKDIINLALDEWDGVCCVRSTQEPVDTTSDAGKMFFTMLGSFADFERSTIKTRTWSGKMKNAEKGRNPGALYPYGYRKGEAATYEIVEEEALVVRRMFEEYLKGKSCRLIAFALNAEGVLTRSDGMWATADISRLLRNPLYTGKLVYNRRNWTKRGKDGKIAFKDPSQWIEVEGAAPAIIDPETWAQVERIRATRPRIGRGESARIQSSPYLLSGIAKCAQCGYSWIGYQGGNKGDRYYACAAARSSGPAKCASRSIKVSTLDAFVVERVLQTWPLKGAFRPEMFETVKKRLREVEARIKGLKGRLSALETALERFKTDYRAGKLTAEVYMEFSQDGRKERDEVTGLLSAAEADRQKVLNTQFDMEQAAGWYARMDAWDKLELTEKQQILRMLVERIVVGRPKGEQDVSVHIDWLLPQQ
jgi:site-specific DNA recombinase